MWYVFKGERFGVSGLPFYIIYRTTRLNKAIERIASSRPNAWRTFWNIGIVTGVGAMIFIFYQLVTNLLNLVYRAQQAVSIQPIIPVPGLLVSFETFPYLVLALSIVVATHELSHGIASLADHVPLKTTGLIYGHVLMGGFVEPDEEKLKQAKSSTKLRVFAAGSYTNVVLGVLVIFLLFNFTATISPFYTVTSSGVTIGSIPTNLPAFFWATSRRPRHQHKWHQNLWRRRPAAIHVSSDSRTGSCIGYSSGNVSCQDGA